MTPRSHDPAIENRGPQTHVQPLPRARTWYWRARPSRRPPTRQVGEVSERHLDLGARAGGEAGTLEARAVGVVLHHRIEDAGAAVIGAGVPHGQVEVVPTPAAASRWMP